MLLYTVNNDIKSSTPLTRIVFYEFARVELERFHLASFAALIDSDNIDTVIVIRVEILDNIRRLRSRQRHFLLDIRRRLVADFYPLGEVTADDVLPPDLHLIAVRLDHRQVCHGGV